MCPAIDARDQDGPGALPTGAAGGATLGFVGYFSVNRTADWIEH